MPWRSRPELEGGRLLDVRILALNVPVLDVFVDDHLVAQQAAVAAVEHLELVLRTDGSRKSDVTNKFAMLT
jgi:hypothetical protein